MTKDETDRCLTRREFKRYRKDVNRALKLQANEYERRLKDLNGEHQRISMYVEKTVTQEAFEDFKKLLDERVGALRKAEDERTGGLILLRILAGAGSFGLILSVLNSLGIRFGG